MLIEACRMFVVEQSGFEKSLSQVDSEASVLAQFIDRIRPARPKPDFDLTPGVLTVAEEWPDLDHKAWRIAQIAVHLRAAQIQVEGAQISTVRRDVEEAAFLLGVANEQAAIP